MPLADPFPPPSPPLSLSLDMEGPGDDIRIPDSWELADLDEAMTRLRFSSAASSSSRATIATPPSEVVPDAVAASASSAASRLPGDVDLFLREALEKPRERLSILRMEQDIEKFIRDPTQQQLELKPVENSYLRLAAYRIAQHYCLQSISVPDNGSPDGASSRIVLRKTYECGSLPIRLADIPVNMPQEDRDNILKVAIKQRPQEDSQTINGVNTVSSRTNHSKSVEERKEEYNKARARIFSGNSSSINGGKPESKTPSPDSFRHNTVASTQSEDKSFVGGPESDIAMGLGYSSGCSSRSNRGRAEKEPVASRYKASSRVAIFRDREMDRKDPDYDRNYERYVQRFDPGFGFTGGTYGIQPLYTPAVNYNTEFPHLGSSHRSSQISVEHQPQSSLQNGQWGAASASSTPGFGLPERLMAPFSANHVYSHANSSIFVPSSQYIAPPRSGMGFIHHHEHGQPFAQTHHQQPESSFASARPR